ncbi:hypothetical protein [Lactobacillus xylocopicola]|uniref:ABC transporter ATP-binding protein n=1 Tax=Lactobacillus xylocopicola TaxID=2976676 RepID=A0ABN6SL50_9LACO|nr:hypothetical protein [Lactobacillus xylocopicola]BDR61055.1 hypothetical protein KIM322_13160 [Lactobacillus xylocopicola]
MNKQRLFPVIYGLISALIAFIAAFFICLRTFHWALPIAVLAASLFAVFFFGLSWFRGHASVEIKRIARELRLTDEELAQITGMKSSDFPIYHDKLQLILPKRYWPKVLDALQKYEREHKQKDFN